MTLSSAAREFINLPGKGFHNAQMLVCAFFIVCIKRNNMFSLCIQVMLSKGKVKFK